MLALGFVVLDVLINVTCSRKNKVRNNILCFAIVK